MQVAVWTILKMSPRSCVGCLLLAVAVTAILVDESRPKTEAPEVSDAKAEVAAATAEHDKALEKLANKQDKPGVPSKPLPVPLTLSSNPKDQHNCHAVVRLVTLPNSSAVRQQNVERITRDLPCHVNVVFGFTAGEERTKQFLRTHRITVSPRYGNGGGVIYGGKIGHWVTFLEFVESLNGGLGVFIENDALISVDLFNTIMAQEPLNLVTHYDPNGDGVDVIDASKAAPLWDELVSNGITSPVDIALNKLGLRTKQLPSVRKIKSDSRTSEILTSDILSIAEYNNAISRVDSKMNQKSFTTKMLAKHNHDNSQFAY